MILTIISLLIFVVYLFFAIKRYGIPTSLSETYYLLGGEPFNRLKASIFTFMMWAISFTLLPAMLDITPEDRQFLIFLALGAICFVGTAPNFKETFEGKVHTTSAVFAAFFGLSWALAMPHGFICVGLSLLAVLVGALATATIKDSRTFWLEMVAFASVYMTAIVNAR